MAQNIWNPSYAHVLKPEVFMNDCLYITITQLCACMHTHTHRSMAVIRNKLPKFDDLYEFTWFCVT